MVVAKNEIDGDKNYTSNAGPSVFSNITDSPRDHRSNCMACESVTDTLAAW